MLRKDILIHARQTAVVLPTPCTLEPLKQVGEVHLSTAITLLVVSNLPRSVLVDLDDACPQHAMAVRITTGIDTCVANYDIAGVTPSVPDIVCCGCEVNAVTSVSLN